MTISPFHVIRAGEERHATGGRLRAGALVAGAFALAAGAGACSSATSAGAGSADGSVSPGAAGSGAAAGTGGAAASGGSGGGKGGTSGAPGAGGTAGTGGTGVAGSGGTSASSGGAPSSGGAGNGGSGGSPSPDGGSLCAAPVASAAPITLADFESGAIPTSDTAKEGFRGSDVARGTVITPGANGTARAAAFSFATDNSLFYQGSARPQYLDGSATYHADLGNALEFYVRIPSGSALLSASGASTFSMYTYHWKPGDPWVGTNGTGGNLTDSQMHGYGPMRFAPGAADRWARVVMTTSAFDHSRGNYHFYAARAIVEDLTFFGALRQFQPVFLAALGAGPASVAFDELRLITVPPTAGVCPAFHGADVPASGGDVLVPVTLSNPGSAARTYRVFLSSVIGLDRQTIETATHDADAVSAVDNLQGAVGSDGGLGAAELFADDGTGNPTGRSVVAAGAGITVAAGGSFRGVVVHHVRPAMLGAAQSVSNAGHTYALRRDTLTTSMIVWDPAAPRIGDPDAVFTGSNADTSHPAPPGFPPYADPPTGWHSTDVPPDQAGAYFVSVLRLQP